MASMRKPKWTLVFQVVQNCGRSTGSRLLSFPFSLHTDALTSCHFRLLQYADDFVIGNPYSKRADQEGQDDSLSRLST